MVLEVRRLCSFCGKRYSKANVVPRLHTLSEAQSKLFMLDTYVVGSFRHFWLKGSSPELTRKEIEQMKKEIEQMVMEASREEYLNLKHVNFGE
jgi:hypothetical protein